MRKKKVLFLLEAFDKGGIEKVTLDIVNNLDPEKYDITVQTFWYGGYCQSRVNDNVKVVPFFFRRYVKGIIRLIEYFPPKLLYTLFVHGKYDVEIAASDGGAAKVISGSTNKKAKKICWVHMDVISRGSKLKEFTNAETGRKIYEKFDRIACVSSTCLSRFTEKFGQYNNIVVAHNPIPVEEVRAQALENVSFKKKVDIFRFITVGRLAVEKGYDRLIQSVSELINNGYSKFEVNIVGDGEQKEKLAGMIEQYNLNGVVNLLGFSANPYPFVKHSDFFICSSYDEAYPLVIGESLFLNTPVLATACAGAREWLGNSEYGILVENSEKGLYEGMKEILDDRQNVVLKWKKAAEDKTAHISMKSQMEEWESIMLRGDEIK